MRIKRLVISLAYAASALAARTPVFDAPRAYLLGSSPAGVAIGDFNGDGIQDLAVPIYATESGVVSILLGKGDGQFQPPVHYNVDWGAASVAVGDFNGDGKLDLAVGTNNFYSANGSNVSIMLGNGDGTFLAPMPYSVQYNPLFVAVADLNHDGKLDLAVVNELSNSVSILLGNGNGTFQNQVTYAVGTQPYSLAVGDFNRDGVLDLAVANEASGNLSILFGNGDGTFQSQVTVTVGANPNSIVAGDFNEDGKLDLAVTLDGSARSSSLVAILVGNGDGTFRRPSHYSAGRSPDSVAVGDLDGDGHLDLAVASTGTYTVTVLLGKGDGTFQTAANDTPGGTFVAIGDFNGDGTPDLVVSPGPEVAILLGKGKGAFQNVPSYDAGLGPYAVAAGDFNHDGLTDLVIANNGPFANGGNTVSVLLGKADGSFQKPVAYTLGYDPSSIAVGDFTGHGNLDVVVSNSHGTPGTFSYLRGNGDGTFQAQVSYSVPGCAGRLTSGDFNGDGKLDVAISSCANGVQIFLGDGNGRFQSPPLSVAVTNPGFLATGDFNGDGKLDLAVSASPNVAILRGNGNGTFQPAVYYPMKSAGSIAVADFNGDGKLDLVVSNYYSNDTVAILLGNGDGAFQAAKNYLGGGGAGALAVADFNGDGDLDLAVTNRNCVSILIGDGHGAFLLPQNFAVGADPEAIAAGTFGKNQSVGVAVANNESGVTIMLGASR